MQMISRIFFVFFITLTVFTVSAQTHVNVETWYDPQMKTLLKESFYVLKKDTKVLDSSFVSWYQSANKKSEGLFVKGKAEGHWKYYYESGGLRMEGEMKDNQNNGKWKYYYENGNPNMEGNVIKGDRDGDWIFYYENGEVKSTGFYDHNQREGSWTYYYEDGVMKAKALYDHDKGEYMEYYPSGKLKSMGPIANGLSDGDWKYFYEDDTLKAEGVEKNGLKEGVWKFYHPNGQLASVGVYVNGQPQGDWKYYYENGQLSAQGVQKDGAKEGDWKLYYKSGEFKGQGTFESGNGPYKEYYENGKLKIEGNVKNDKSDGPWKYYYENGDLEGECFFVSGSGHYRGYYPSGKLKMEGTIRDGNKVGIWTLYKENGEVAGYYTTYYENDAPVFKELEPKDSIRGDSIGPVVLPPAKFHRKKSIHFTPRVNEFNGVIVSTNPFGPLGHVLPVYLEYYYQERLGYEFNYTLYRDPFFKSHNDQPLGRLSKQGYSVFLRQKLYLRDKDRGMFYYAHELRYTRLSNSVKAIDTTFSFTDPVKLSLNQNVFEYSAIFGDRIVRDARKQGLTLDLFIGLGLGYRIGNNSWTGNNSNYDFYFASVKKSPLSVSFRAGFTIGYIFKVQR